MKRELIEAIGEMSDEEAARIYGSLDIILGSKKGGKIVNQEFEICEEKLLCR